MTRSLARPVLRLSLYVLSIVVWSSAAAQSQRATSSFREKASDVRSSTEVALEEQRAKDWGLQREEWVRYRQLMSGPLGLHSPNLDPLTALGIEARSDAERRRYAELQVRIEAHRVEKLLAYQRAYDEAWKRLHPTLQPVNLSNPSETLHQSASVGSVPQRLAVFVKDDCPPCDAKVKELQAAGHSFDVYMVGTRQEDARIRRWATRADVDPAKVRARTITLNHDAGRWLSLGARGELPAVLREVNGQWRRE